MPLSDVYLVSPHLQTIAKAEIDALQTSLGFELPRGYREYMQQLGKGKFCHGLQVYTPDEVLKPANISYWQDAMLPAAIEDGLWDGRPLLNEAELRKAVVFATTNQGDLFVACPQRPGELFELPRHDNKMFAYMQAFAEPFAFQFCLISKFNLPFFEPPKSRQVSAAFEIKEPSQMVKVWEHVASVGSTPLRVAEGQIGVTKRVLAFIPDISGCAWQDDVNRISFFSIQEHTEAFEKLMKELAQYAKSSV